LACPPSSHQRAVAAIDAGRFDAEIVLVGVKDGAFTANEGPRRATTLDWLAALRPASRADGIVMAGSASPLSDGAVALVLSGEDAVAHNATSPPNGRRTRAHPRVHPSRSWNGAPQH
jgi:acetyl-CoA acetyltransferase